jgi:hypothetical protein
MVAILDERRSHDGLKFVLYEHNYELFSSPGHRPYELLSSGLPSFVEIDQVVYDEKIF